MGSYEERGRARERKSIKLIKWGEEVRDQTRQLKKRTTRRVRGRKRVRKDG